RKNIAACVRACAVLRDEGHRFRYLIGGRGPELESIRALVAELGLPNCVKVLGKVPGHRLPGLYRRADIFLHPQIAVDDERDFEGFGITIADAMAHGMAAIAGQAGGPGDIIENGRTGLLVDGSDDAAIIAALQRLLIDGQARQAMAEAGRQHALRHFQWDRHVAGILPLFTSFEGESGTAD
ncbi:MAG TPA: glycosyltransferase, partial [Lautropia sp.]|nr:glycosyltransferase [Lautropia sp.]